MVGAPIPTPIPRYIHHVWPGDDPIPTEYATYINSWKTHHPNWECVLWTPTEIAALGLDKSLIYSSADKHAPHDHLRFKADIARLEILYIYGGVYVDMDISCLRPIDPILEEVTANNSTAFVGRSPNAKSNEFVITNAVMGAIPNHRWLRECILQIPASVLKFKGRHIAKMVGPHLITRAFNRIDGWDVYLIPTDYFFPLSIAERDKGEEPDLTNSYGYHRWASSRDKRWPRRGGKQ